MAFNVGATTVIDSSRNIINVLTVTATSFVGPLTGNASSATSVSGSSSNGFGTRTIQSGGTASGGSDGDIYYIF
jgi:hypothetical protein